MGGGWKGFACVLGKPSCLQEAVVGATFMQVCRCRYLQTWQVILQRAQEEEESCRESVYPLRDTFIVMNRKMNARAISGEASDGNEEEHAIRNGGKATLLQSGRELAQSGCSVLCKAVHVHDELGYLAEMISKPGVEVSPWFVPTAYSKRREQREKCKKLLSKRNQKVKTWEGVSLSILQK